MFTIQQIKAAHTKVQSGADFPAYIKEIKAFGVIHYDFIVADGSINYYGLNNYHAVAPAIYPEKSIAVDAQPLLLKQTIKEHQDGKSDFLTFCQLAADAGVEKWVVDTQSMLCTYFSSAGLEIVAEPIPK